jgi:hypothetical protein
MNFPWPKRTYVYTKLPDVTQITEDNFLLALHQVFEQFEPGKAVLEMWVGQVLYSPSFVPGQPDVQNVNEGKRAFVREILSGLEKFHNKKKTVVELRKKAE